MSEKIVQLNEEVIKDQIKELVRGSVGALPRHCCLPAAHGTRGRWPHPSAR